MRSAIRHLDERAHAHHREDQTPHDPMLSGLWTRHPQRRLMNDDEHGERDEVRAKADDEYFFGPEASVEDREEEELERA